MSDVWSPYGVRLITTPECVTDSEFTDVDRCIFSPVFSILRRFEEKQRGARKGRLELMPAAQCAGDTGV